MQNKKIGGDLPPISWFWIFSDWSLVYFRQRGTRVGILSSPNSWHSVFSL